MGTGIHGTDNEDVINATSAGKGQTHIFARDGNDILNFNFPEVIVDNRDDGYVSGHHAYGGAGADEFHFNGVANIIENDLKMVGRIDDFDPNQDKIVIDGQAIDLFDLPSEITLADGTKTSIRVVEYDIPNQPGNQDLSLQQFLLIGENLMYALEGARLDPMSEATGQEAHFFVWEGDPSELKTVEFIDQQNFVPESAYDDVQFDREIVGGVRDIVGSRGNDFVFQNKQGSGDNNTINGREGDDVLNGSHGYDTILGGAGNDSIAGGIDADELYGGEGDDHIWGGSEDDHVKGEEGNDRLWGGTGHDMLDGGAGNDTLVDGHGLDTLAGGQGNDTFSLVADDAEDVISDFNADEDVLLISNWKGLTKKSELNVTETTDGAVVSFGSERVVLFANDGNPLSVEQVMNAVEVEASAIPNVETPSAENPVVEDEASPKQAPGENSEEQMIGTAGDDVFHVSRSRDSIVENKDEGHDTVYSTASYSLRSNSQHLEDLVLAGSGNISGTGNGQNNLIEGNEGDNRLNGAWGDDTLIGGAGNDTFKDDRGTDLMIGGTGDDIYFVDRSRDSIVEHAGEGHDTVNSSTNYSLRSNSQHLEDLVLTGEANASGTGNGQDNRILGNAGNNRLNGAWGNDTLIGGAGNDTFADDRGDDVLTGGTGADTFVFRKDFGQDRITDFNREEGDTIRLSKSTGIENFGDLIANYSGQQGNDVVIDAGQHGQITLEDSMLADLAEDQFTFV